MSTDLFHICTNSGIPKCRHFWDLVRVSWQERCPDFQQWNNTYFYCIGTKQSVLIKQHVLISGCPHLGVPLYWSVPIKQDVLISGCPHSGVPLYWSVPIKQDVLISGCPHSGVPLYWSVPINKTSWFQGVYIQGSHCTTFLAQLHWGDLNYALSIQWAQWYAHNLSWGLVKSVLIGERMESSGSYYWGCRHNTTFDLWTTTPKTTMQIPLLILSRCPDQGTVTCNGVMIRELWPVMVSWSGNCDL